MIRLLRLPFLLVGLLVAGLPVPAIAVADPAVTVSPVAGPPTTAVTLTASGFGANEAVDVYAETTAIKLAVSSSTGAVSVATTVPASAPPGAYWFTMIGRRTGTAAQVAFTVRTDSPDVGFGSTRGGYNRYENTITASTAPSLQLKWSAKIIATGPVVTSAGRLFLADSTGHAVALDPKTGATRWSVAAATAGYVLSPAVAGGTVAYPRNDGAFVGLNTANGATRWTLPAATGSVTASNPPVVAGTTVVLSTSDGTVRGVAAATGAVLWTATVSGPIFGTAVSLAAGIVVVAGNSALFALDLASGAQVWSKSLSASPTAPTIAANVVVAGYGTNLCTWDLSTGSPDVCAAESVNVSALSVAANQVYVVGAGEVMQSLDLSTLTVRWTSPVSAYTQQPFVAGGLVWVAGVKSKFTAVDAGTGAAVASVGSYAIYAPVVVDGVLYTGATTGSGRMNAFSLPDATTDDARPDIATLAARSLHNAT